MFSYLNLHKNLVEKVHLFTMYFLSKFVTTPEGTVTLKRQQSRKSLKCG